MWVLVTQSCPTLCNPMDCSPPGSSVHGILQARILEWVAIPFSRGPSQHKDWTLVFCIAGRFLTVCIAGKPIDKPKTQANDVPIEVWAEKDQEVLASIPLPSTHCLKCTPHHFDFSFPHPRLPRAFFSRLYRSLRLEYEGFQILFTNHILECLDHPR